MFAEKIYEHVLLKHALKHININICFRSDFITAVLVNKNKNDFTCPFTTLGFLPRMKRSVISLFGRVMNNNELCFDWLFHSAA